MPRSEKAYAPKTGKTAAVAAVPLSGVVKDSSFEDS